jgi:hypothetical protein
VEITWGSRGRCPEVSEETDQPQPLTGRARSLANLRPFVKGQIGNAKGRPKDLARFGDILMREFYKTILASLAGKTVNKTQARSWRWRW